MAAKKKRAFKDVRRQTKDYRWRTWENQFNRQCRDSLMQTKKFFFAIFAMLVIQACTTKRPAGASVDVVVEARASPKLPPGGSYLLSPGNTGVAEDDPEFRKYAGYLRRAFSERGFSPALKPAQATIKIVLSYGVVDPRLPTGKKPGPAWMKTHFDAGTSTGLIDPESGKRALSGDLPAASSYGMVAQTASEAGTMYFRYVEIDAYPAGVPGGKSLWTTRATSLGPSGDLSRVFPYLVVAAARHLASTTARPASEDIRESELSE